jgi:hypothetical protein
MGSSLGSLFNQSLVLTWKKHWRDDQPREVQAHLQVVFAEITRLCEHRPLVLGTLQNSGQHPQEQESALGMQVHQFWPLAHAEGRGQNSVLHKEKSKTSADSYSHPL